MLRRVAIANVRACPGGRARTTDRSWATAPATPFVHRVVKGFAGLEDRHPAGGDADGIVGLRISASAGCAVLGGELHADHFPLIARHPRPEGVSG